MAKKKTITAIVKLNFSNDPDVLKADVTSNGVPTSMILESLNNLSKGLSQQLVDDAETFITKDKIEEYLDAKIRVDRRKLKEMLL